jgi:hypothetical protein
MRFTEYKKKLNILIIENQNKLLCSAICNLLSKEPYVAKVDSADLIEDKIPACNPGAENLLIVFSNFQISLLGQKLTHWAEKNYKIILVLSNLDSFAMHYFYNYPISAITTTTVGYTEFLGAIQIVMYKQQRFIDPVLISSFSPKKFKENPFNSLSKKEFDVAISMLIGKKTYR